MFQTIETRQLKIHPEGRPGVVHLDLSEDAGCTRLRIETEDGGVNLDAEGCHAVLVLYFDGVAWPVPARYTISRGMTLFRVWNPSDFHEQPPEGKYRLWVINPGTELDWLNKVKAQSQEHYDFLTGPASSLHVFREGK